jgi:methylenetetrahydrofolate--tRNA-(uracil-5-)-methyltransferase
LSVWSRKRTRPPRARSCRYAFGALLGHITGGHVVSDDEPGKRSFQPMNVNFGPFPPIEAPKAEGKRLRGKDKTNARKRAVTGRALADCREWLGVEKRAEAAE